MVRQVGGHRLTLCPTPAKPAKGRKGADGVDAETQEAGANPFPYKS